MNNLEFGKGVYVWQPQSIERGDPHAIAARFKLAGVQTAAVKICDGFKVLGGLEALIQTLRDNEIRVGAWGYSYLNRAPVQEANVIADACKRYQPDFYLIDVETEVEGNFGGARMFINTLRPSLPNLPLGLNSFWNARLHPSFPWADFLNAVDFSCPQVYGHGQDPVARLIESQQTYGEIPNVPHVNMPVVAGDMHTFKGMRPTPDQLVSFLAAADSDPFIKGVLMWAADDTQVPPDLWQTFSNYQWRAAGRAIPPQPLGWAKITAGGGMWIRTAPAGAKVGALAKGELAPVWHVTDTRWGAVTQDAEKWVFLGNSSEVETTIDLGGQSEPPPAGLEQFQARVVPTRGLNVRQGIGGRVLRALRVNTIVRVYESKSGWARIHPAQDEWVSASFLKPLTA